jgi:hypothetical protein
MLHSQKPLRQGRYRKNEGVRLHDLACHLAVSLLTRKYKIQANRGSRAQSVEVTLGVDKRAPYSFHNQRFFGVKRLAYGEYCVTYPHHVSTAVHGSPTPVALLGFYAVLENPSHSDC